MGAEPVGESYNPRDELEHSVQQRRSVWPSAFHSGNLRASAGWVKRCLLACDMKLIKYYYLLTPLFFVLDIIFGWQVRVITPWNSPIIRIIYYAICFAVGIALRKNEVYLSLFGLAECVVNITLLILTYMLVLYNPVDNWDVLTQLKITDLLHVILVSSAMIRSFHENPIVKRHEERVGHYANK